MQWMCGSVYVCVQATTDCIPLTCTAPTQLLCLHIAGTQHVGIGRGLEMRKASVLPTMPPLSPPAVQPRRGRGAWVPQRAVSAGLHCHAAPGCGRPACGASVCALGQAGALKAQALVQQHRHCDPGSKNLACASGVGIRLQAGGDGTPLHARVRVDGVRCFPLTSNRGQPCFFLALFSSPVHFLRMLNALALAPSNT